MTIKIEEGKAYRSRDGGKWRSAQKFRNGQPGLYALEGPDLTGSYLFYSDGRLVKAAGKPHGFDLVAEWQSEEEITRNVANKAGQQKDEPAWKEDGGKPRLDLIAPEFLMATADILAFGANKYAARNWEKGMSWGRCFGALMRHMWAWWGGEKVDAETGKSHLWHAACCLMFLIAYEERQIGVDDRKATPENLS
jgi:hypothetical protein